MAAAKRNQTEIFSIFGQIEAVVAEAMIDEGKGKRIKMDDIPASALFNDVGKSAVFAIVLNRRDIPEFERRIKELRA